jgi:hypothetical protein
MKYDPAFEAVTGDRRDQAPGRGPTFKILSLQTEIMKPGCR